MVRRKPAVLSAVLGGLAIAATGYTGTAGTSGPAAGVAAETVSTQRYSGGPAGLQRFYRQILHWGPCDPEQAIASGAADTLAAAQQAIAGFQCAELTVPLDYAKPGGATIKLAMNRLPASSPAQRIGPLLTNPGGPGASGLEWGFRARVWATAQLRAHYDIVGMDPRGVGLSSPVMCKPTPGQEQQLQQNPTPLVQATVTANACARTAGRLIPFVGTENAARDLDIARAVLRERKLDYFGASYGTLLGQVYANMFPRSVGRMVLDSVDSPASGSDPAAQAVSFEETFQFMVQTCIARGNCAMGSSQGAVLASFKKLLRRLESRRLPAGSDREPLTAEAVLGFVSQSLYNERDWPRLETVLGALFEGEHVALPSTQLPGFSGQSFDAINCLTIAQRLRTVAAAVQAGRAAQAAAPHFGNDVLALWLTCAKWPVPSPPGAGHLIHAPGTPPILLVSNTVDPATPLAWAREVHAALASSVLVTNVAGGHGFYGMGSCTNRVVDNFLISDTRPAPGTVCHNRNPALVGPAMTRTVP